VVFLHCSAGGCDECDCHVTEKVQYKSAETFTFFFLTRGPRKPARYSSTVFEDILILHFFLQRERVRRCKCAVQYEAAEVCGRYRTERGLDIHKRLPLLSHEDLRRVAMRMLVGLTCRVPNDTHSSISQIHTAVTKRTLRASLALA
jgi:hypothetical protein